MSTRETYRNDRETHLTIDPHPRHAKWECPNCGCRVTNLAICPECGGAKAREEAVSAWRKWRKAILGTLGAAGVWIAAILSVQQPTILPALPIQQVAAQAWIVTNDYRVAVSNWKVTIRTGFRCDLASIPHQARGPLGLTSDSPSLQRAALVHDALYASRLLPRDTADSILYAMALQDGTDPDKARAIYEAVSLWGWVPWDRNTAESVWRAGQLVQVQKRP